LKNELDFSVSEEDGYINDESISGDSEEGDAETYCEKSFICEKFGKGGELWYRRTDCGVGISGWI
jgi:hypothetical protein